MIIVEEFSANLWGYRGLYLSPLGAEQEREGPKLS